VAVALVVRLPSVRLSPPVVGVGVVAVPLPVTDTPFRVTVSVAVDRLTCGCTAPIDTKPLLVPVDVPGCTAPIER
jgi:hypothetical protein